MKIAIIKETKIPIDNRVALTPKQVASLNEMYPMHEIVVQGSDIRAFSDDEYKEAGVRVVDNVEDCDILFGIKEANIDILIPNKHYFFFGHIAKMQSYNRPLLRKMIEKHITFSDYEYLVDDNNQRLCAFGWWAGYVGVYYTLRGYGLRTHLFELPKPNLKITKEEMMNVLKSVQLPPIKILITGNGRVSQGAQYILNAIGAVRLSKDEYLTKNILTTLSYCVAGVEDLVRHRDNLPFIREDFAKQPTNYISNFSKWAFETDILISAHFWDSNAPVYLDKQLLKDKRLRIQMIGDITCDIQGSLLSTLRSSTHEAPYYDYNPLTEREEAPFNSDSNITIMAVDTCPNALPLDTSAYFGNMLIKHVLTPLLREKKSLVIERATIIQNGNLTERFNYLENFAKS